MTLRLPLNAPEVTSVKSMPWCHVAQTCPILTLLGSHTVAVIFTHPRRACQRAQITCKWTVWDPQQRIQRNAQHVESQPSSEQSVACEFSWPCYHTTGIEQVAEARHREALASTEHVVQTMVSEMSRRFNAEEEAARARMHQMMKLAESREGQYSQYREEFGLPFFQPRNSFSNLPLFSNPLDPFFPPPQNLFFSTPQNPFFPTPRPFLVNLQLFFFNP